MIIASCLIAIIACATSQPQLGMEQFENISKQAATILKEHGSGTIDAKFKTFGCGSAIASSSYATEYIKGKYVHEAMNITNSDISKYLDLPPVKLHCSMLAEDAVKSAIKDYENK